MHLISPFYRNAASAQIELTDLGTCFSALEFLKKGGLKEKHRFWLFNNKDTEAIARIIGALGMTLSLYHSLPLCSYLVVFSQKLT